MSGGNPQQPIIIKRVKGGGHGGHHGGAWKVAYADFTTAMMSFFLLLWLLNVTTSDQRQGIADYFAPASVSMSNSGAGGPMGGKTITAEGAQVANGAPPTQDEDSVPTAGKGTEGDEDQPGKSSGTRPPGQNDNDKGTGLIDLEGQGSGQSSGNQTNGEKAAGMQDKGDNAAGAGSKSNANDTVNFSGTSDAKVIEEALKRENERFQQAEEAIKSTIQNSAELSSFASQILVDRTSEGLRIQIVDQDNYSMFPSGSALLYEKARDLLHLVGKVVSKLPNNVSVTGHTDSAPFALGSRRDNWTLSTERANVSRAELVAAGVSETRVARVVGLADRDALIPQNPKDPKNRRISIVLLRQKVATQKKAPAPATSAPTPAASAPAPAAPANTAPASAAPPSKTSPVIAPAIAPATAPANTPAAAPTNAPSGPQPAWVAPPAAPTPIPAPQIPASIRPAAVVSPISTTHK